MDRFMDVDPVLFVVGTKNDLDKDTHAVDEKDAIQYAKQRNATFMTVSAKTNDGIDQLFTQISMQIAENSQRLSHFNTFKIILMGDYGVGKTSIIQNYIHHAS